MLDVAIVGAGAAGLAAARAAIGLGLRTTVLEAKDRIGGRTLTRELWPGLPVDLGARWLHSADINPLAAYGASAGFTLGRSDLELETFFADESRWADSRERQDRLAFFEACELAIRQAAKSGRDVRVTEVLPDHPRWRPAFEHWVSIYTAVDPGQASTSDYANYRDTHQNWPIREGYGSLIAHFGAGLPVALRTPVREIDYSGRSVRLVTATGTVEAKAAILTVSTGVLSAEVIRFDPPLPEWKRDAIAALPMGHANWVVLGFERNPFGATETRLASLWAPSSRNMVFQIRSNGADIAIGFVSGSLCRDLEREGTAAMLDFAIQKLKSMFGAHVERSVTAQMTSTWSGDPAVRGSYAAALPGRAHLRAPLAVSIDERLFFAGEATDPEFFTTVHGAYRSGVRAAHEVAHALGADH